MHTLESHGTPRAEKLPFGQIFNGLETCTRSFRCDGIQQRCLHDPYAPHALGMFDTSLIYRHYSHCPWVPCRATEAFFIDEEDLVDRLIEHGELEHATPSAFATFWGAAPTLIKGQLMLQALDCLQQNPAGSSGIQGLREQMLALMKIDFAKPSLEELTEGLGSVKVGALWCVEVNSRDTRSRGLHLY